MKTHTFIRLTAAALIGAATVFSSCKKVIDETTVKEIIITDPASKSLTLEQGDDYRIYYDVLPSSALNTAVIDWSSSDERIAGVSGFDRIYAYAPGNATITGKCGDAEVEIEVTVTKVQVTSFTVPEKLTIYVGLENEIEITIEPAKANASSLDWEYDKEMVELNFKEGKAIVKGLKSGSCAMTVKSESTAKTIALTIKELTERIKVNYTSITDTKNIVVQNGDNVSWNDLTLGVLSVTVGNGISLPEDVTVSSSNPSVCKEFIYHKFTNSAAWYQPIWGEEFGSSEITVSTTDKQLNTVHKLSFTLTSEPKGIPGDITVKVDKTILKNGDSYRMDKNSQKEFNIDPLYKYYANWTFNGGNVSIEHVWGNDVWSYGAKITTGEQTGITTVTVKDQTGKSMSFNINVTEQIFSEGIYIIDDETGKKAEGAVYIPCGGSKIFRLSNENYKGKWSVGRPEYYTVEPISPDENGYCTKVKVTTTKDAWQKGTYIQVVDKANLNSISVDGLEAGIDFSKMVRPALTTEGIRIEPDKIHSFTWNGKKTNYFNKFYIVDGYNTKYEKLPGVTFSIEKSDEESIFLISANQTMMQRTGEIPVTWKEKYGREAKLTLTDHWGTKRSYIFKPKIDFFNGKWRIHQKYNGKSHSTTWYDLPKDPPNRKIIIPPAQNFDTIDNEKGWEEYEIFFINTDDNQGFAWDYKCYYIDCQVYDYNNYGYYKDVVLNEFKLRPWTNISSKPTKHLKLCFSDSQGKPCYIEIHFNYEY